MRVAWVAVLSTVAAVTQDAVLKIKSANGTLCIVDPRIPTLDVEMDVSGLIMGKDVEGDERAVISVTLQAGSAVVVTTLDGAPYRYNACGSRLSGSRSFYSPRTILAVPTTHLALGAHSLTVEVYREDDEDPVLSDVYTWTMVPLSGTAMDVLVSRPREGDHLLASACYLTMRCVSMALVCDCHRAIGCDVGEYMAFRMQLDDRPKWVTSTFRAGTPITDGTLQMPTLAEGCATSNAEATRCSAHTLSWVLWHKNGEIAGSVNFVVLTSMDEGRVWKLDVRATEFEEDEYGLFDVAFSPGDVVVDAGANIGFFSILVAKRCPECRILALEPITANYDNLLWNLEANEVDNVIALQVALTGDGRDVQAVFDLYHPGSSGIYFDNTTSYHVAETVRSVTLEGIMEEYAVQRIALLKMDCEGCEYEVIPKAPFDKIDAVVGELHVTANATLKQQTEELLFKHRPKNASRTVFQHYGARMMPPR